jgi:SAM-dependent methyltransferase
MTIQRINFKGFPVAALELLRCPLDGGELCTTTLDPFIESGEVHCRTCTMRAAVTNGILDLMIPDGLDPESRHELAVREQEWAVGTISQTEEDLAEIAPHIEAVRLQDSSQLLELGCGTGRYTFRLAEECALVVAVDFSQAALESIVRNGPCSNVALVRADIQQLIVRFRSFDAVLSTLTSNLPTAERRHRLYGLAASALKENGCFVSGAHYYGFKARLTGVAKKGYYNQGGIYRYYMTRSDIRGEMGSYFEELHMQPVQILLGLARRLRMSPLRFSRALEHVPAIRDAGLLLMTVARKPKRV